MKDSNDNTLNIIEFTSDPSGYTFYTRDASGSDTEIPASLLVVPPRIVGDGSESDPFLATAADDTFTGSADADWVSYEGSTYTVGVSVDLRTDPATVSRGAAADTLSGINNLIGSDYGDSLIGNDGDNILRGGVGRDSLEGDGGADTLDGGAGEDVASYDNFGKGVRVSLALTTAQIDFDGSHGFTTNDNDAVGDILTNIENIEGSNDNDWLTGDNSNNRLYGKGGNDRLEGGEGDDTLQGGEGSDTLIGGDGADLDIYIFGSNDGTDKDTIIDEGYINLVFLQGTGNDYAGATYSFAPADAGLGEAVTLTVSKDGNTLNVIEFATYDPSPYTYTFYTGLLGGDGGDRIHGGDGNDWIDGDDGYDYLYGGEGKDYLYGGEGGDRLYGGEGNDYLYGGEDNDRIYDDWLHGDDGNDYLYGGDGGDYLYGGEDNDILYGGEGKDNLNGEEGADTYAFNPGDGKDSIVDDGGKIVFIQGAGNDYTGATYSFVRADEGRGVAVTLTVKDSNDNTLNVLKFTKYLLTTIYTFYTRDASGIDTEIPASLLVVPLGVEGTESNPFLATDADDTFTGSDDADWLSYAGSTDTAGVSVDLLVNPAIVSSGATGDRLTGINNLIGSDYNDYLIGNGGDNILRGGVGKDSLEGDGGADTLDGGAGEDVASYDNSGKGVRVSLALTTAQIDFDGSHGFTTNDNDAVGDILTNIENIEGSNDNDWLTGDNSNNRLYGKGGNDRLEGGEGKDYLYGGKDNDILYGGEGYDYLYGGEGNDWLYGNDGYDELYGGDGGDWLYGGEDNDILYGGEGYDYLYGGEGYDWLYGNDGDDELYGGAGEDTYVFGKGDGTDTVIDDGGKIVFFQGLNDDYEGATYSFSSVNGKDRLTVTKDGNTLNVIDFSGAPSLYTFYTGSVSPDNEIPASLLVVPPRLIEGSEGNPFLATDADDTFTGSDDADWLSYAGSTDTAGVSVDLLVNPAIVSSGATGDRLTGINNLIGSNYGDSLSGNNNANTLRGGEGKDELFGGRGSDLLLGEEGEDKYYFDACDGVGTYGVDVIKGDGDETGNKVVFLAPLGVTYTDSNFYFTRGDINYNPFTLHPDFTGSQTGDDLQIVVHDGGSGDDRVYWNNVYIEDYFDQPDAAYTIYRIGYSYSSLGTIISTAPDETS